MSGTRKTSTIPHADIVCNSRLAAPGEDRAPPRPLLGQSGLIYLAIDPQDGQIVKSRADDGLTEFCVVEVEQYAAGVLNGSICILTGSQ